MFARESNQKMNEIVCLNTNIERCIEYTHTHIHVCVVLQKAGCGTRNFFVSFSLSKVFILK